MLALEAWRSNFQYPGKSQAWQYVSVILPVRGGDRRTPRAASQPVRLSC